jgi:hypothetical protein
MLLGGIFMLANVAQASLEDWTTGLRTDKCSDGDCFKLVFWEGGKIVELEILGKDIASNGQREILRELYTDGDRNGGFLVIRGWTSGLTPVANSYDWYMVKYDQKSIMSDAFGFGPRCEKDCGLKEPKALHVKHYSGANGDFLVVVEDGLADNGERSFRIALYKFQPGGVSLFKDGVVQPSTVKKTTYNRAIEFFKVRRFDEPGYAPQDMSVWPARYYDKMVEGRVDSSLEGERIVVRFSSNDGSISGFRMSTPILSGQSQESESDEEAKPQPAKEPASSSSVYKLADGSYVVPADAALAKGRIITPSGYIYKVTGKKDGRLQLKLSKRIAPSLVGLAQKRNILLVRKK